MKQSNNFIITINNPTIDVPTFIQKIKLLKFTYCTAQLERGESNTLHIQACFGGIKKRFDQIKKHFIGAHIESAAHPAKAFEYCSKTESRVGENHQFGKPPLLRNNKLDVATKNKQIIDLGVERAVSDGLIPIGDYKRVKISVELYKQSTSILAETNELINEWVYGDPGVGKSQYARSAAPRQDIFSKPANKWWDGYQEQSTIIIDDLGLEHACLGHHIKIWSDHYPFNAEIKNGSTSIRPKKIIITSNYTPQEIWPNNEKMVKAVTRRFKLIYMPPKI